MKKAIVLMAMSCGSACSIISGLSEFELANGPIEKPDIGGGGNGGIGMTGGSGGQGHGGGATGDGNDTFETAEEIEVNSATIGNLDPVGEDVDYYMFQGQAGQKLALGINAKPDDNPTDPTYPDTVITLYDEFQSRIAQNDDVVRDRNHNSQLFTVLPADGIYYIRVAECGRVFGAQSCGPLTDVVNTEYTMRVSGFNPAYLVDEKTPGPTSFEYSGAAGSYEQKILTGTFSADSEVDIFEFTVPADVMVDAGARSLTQFTFFEFGPDGSGSSAAVEYARISEVNTGNTVAEIQGEKGGSILVPLMPGGTYQVHVEHVTGAVGNNPFYFGWTFPEISSNPIEFENIDPMSPMPNNDPASAQNLTGRAITGGMAYDIEADLEAPILTGTDFFRFQVTGYTKVQAVCTAWVDGSGVRNLNVSILYENGTPITDATETATAEALTAETDVPAGASNLILRISGDQDPEVTSNYYRCVVAAYNP